MSSQWKIGGTLVKCTSLNIGTATADTAEILLMDGVDITFADGDILTLTCDGTNMITGRAKKSRAIDGAAEQVAITITGPWERLESIVYQQGTKVAVDHAVDEDHPLGFELTEILTPDVMLGIADDGTRRTTLQEVKAIASYANGVGVGMAALPSLGFTGMTIPPVSLNGSSCAACILSMLRFHPDVLIYFDYSVVPPVLTAKKIADMSAVNYPGSYDLTAADFVRNLNYKPAGVRIVYTRTGANGRTEAHVDAAGDTSGQGKGERVINWLTKLEGANPPPLQSQQIRTRPIPHSDDPEHPEEDETELKTNWWQSQLIWLAQPDIGEIVEITNHTVTVDPPNITASEDPDATIPTTWSEDPDDYPRELIDGTIPEWMEGTLVSAPLTVEAEFKLLEVPSDLSDALKALLKRLFGDVGNTITRYAKVTGTNATTREYYAPATISGPPEWPASGIATAFMNSFAAAAWSGSLTLTGDAQPLVALGTLANVTGHHAAWASMGAVVRSVSYSPDSHSVTVSCATPDGYGFSDFYQLQNAIKDAAGVDPRGAAELRTKAIPSTAGRIRGAGFTANRGVGSDDRKGESMGGLVPWDCTREGLLTLRVWPADMWDGQGNHFEINCLGVIIAPEAYVDIPVEEDAGSGHLYVRCPVDDTHDLHGLLGGVCELELDFEDHSSGGAEPFFKKLSGPEVLIPIATVSAAEGTFTFTPLRSFVMCLRRFGPPGSTAWDVTPMG